MPNTGIPLTTASAHRKNHNDDLVCFSHLRWNFVFQRPQHLMTRFARERRVFFFEEPFFDSSKPTLELTETQGVVVAVPHLPERLDRLAIRLSVRQLLSDLLCSNHVGRAIFWYYTPMALEFSRELPNAGIVFDVWTSSRRSRARPPRC